MNGKQIRRTTEVVSVSLEPLTLSELDKARKINGQTRSAFMSSLIKKYIWEARWEQIRKWGEESAKKMKITSEEDIYKLLGDA